MLTGPSWPGAIGCGLIVAAVLAYIDMQEPFGDYVWLVLLAPGLILVSLRYWWPRRPRSRVPIRVMSRQTEVSQLGGDSLHIAVFVELTNELDIPVTMDQLVLQTQIGRTRKDCRFQSFQRAHPSAILKDIIEIVVPPKNSISGWAHFICPSLDIDSFRQFVFSANAIGEPVTWCAFKPNDWDSVRQGNSIVTFTMRHKERPRKK